LLTEIEKLISKKLTVVKDHPYPLVAVEGMPVMKFVKVTSKNSSSNSYFRKPANKKNAEFKPAKYR